MVSLINTTLITYTVSVDEGRIRGQLRTEALRMHGLLADDGSAPKGTTVRVARNGGRGGGYTVTIVRDLAASDQPLIGGPS